MSCRDAKRDLWEWVIYLAVSTDVELILSRDQVAAILGISLPTLWRLVDRGEFPEAIQISPGRKGWLASVVRQWLAERRSGGNGRE